MAMKITPIGHGVTLKDKPRSLRKIMVCPLGSKHRDLELKTGESVFQSKGRWYVTKQTVTREHTKEARLWGLDIKARKQEA